MWSYQDVSAHALMDARPPGCKVYKHVESIISEMSTLIGQQDPDGALLEVSSSVLLSTPSCNSTPTHRQPVHTDFDPFSIQRQQKVEEDMGCAHTRWASELSPPSSSAHFNKTSHTHDGHGPPFCAFLPMGVCSFSCQVRDAQRGGWWRL